jgi:hypothetical protein
MCVTNPISSDETEMTAEYGSVHKMSRALWINLYDIFL